MQKQVNRIVYAVILCGTLVAAKLTFAQGSSGGGGGNEGGGQETAGFVDIIYGGSVVNLLIWCLIALVSMGTVALIIDAFISVKREKLMPPELEEGVRESLDEGDLDGAIENCEATPAPLSNILMQGFSNVEEGYDVVQDAVSSAAELENERVMQRVNYLNLAGQIAPMLGLLGTVTGMVRAFAGLAQASGAAKATILAQSISTALWTTATGLLIAVPALFAYTIARNLATRLVLEMEATVLDLIKVLKNASVEE